MKMTTDKQNSKISPEFQEKAPEKARYSDALKLAKRGFHLFPVAHNDKDPPTIANWNAAATTDPATLKKWFYTPNPPNIAIAAKKSGLLIADLDMKRGDGIAAFRAIVGDDGMKTLTSETPSGGQHKIYKMPAGMDIANSVGKIDGSIDIRSNRGTNGGYIVAPGSVVDGKPYRFLADVPIADAPQSLIDAIVAVSARAERRAAPAGIEVDTPAAIDSARQYLAEDAPIAIEGRGGDITTYAVACKIRDMGISEDTVLGLMCEYYDPRCVPPWGSDLMAVKVANAYRYAQNEIGCDTPEANFEIITDWPAPGGEFADIDALLAAANDNSDTGTRPGGLRFRSLADLDADTTPAREYIIKGVLAKGDIACIFGKPGVGKSLLAPYVAMKVARGERVFGRRTRQGPVFYVAAEDAAGMTVRAKALRRRHGDAPDFILVDNVSDLKNEKGRDFKQLMAGVLAQQPVLIVIDTLSLAFPC